MRSNEGVIGQKLLSRVRRDLSRRLGQLDHISGLDDLKNIEVWLGGLFFPEAYVTAGGGAQEEVDWRK